MYRLMKSEKLILNHILSGSLSLYRQIQIKQFPQLSKAVDACKNANRSGESRFYILNDSGKELYGDSWID